LVPSHPEDLVVPEARLGPLLLLDRWILVVLVVLLGLYFQAILKHLTVPELLLVRLVQKVPAGLRYQVLQAPHLVQDFRGVQKDQ